ncbi:MAG: hypothetical protein KGJ30_17780 [Burkholderiales bacterium]|nr:hypothetical protein [Burkholderiales bacterium]MDE2160768.1 hypothetical protein [Burkholderiales bacterium]
MPAPDPRLRRHLAITIVVKLLLLALLWWAFVRDAGVPVDAERAAAHIAGTTDRAGTAP